MSNNQDTIAAIATPHGTGGIGIIRISGQQAHAIGRLLFTSKKKITVFESHRLYYGELRTCEEGRLLDEVMITFMHKPRSYTGDDSVEIHCHGGALIVRSILEEVTKAGARLAHPGEFTKRAFLNNRLDLTQAEAVIDLIMAKTERGLSFALSHLNGALSKTIEAIRSQIIDILAQIEMAIDFTDDAISDLSTSELYGQLGDIIAEAENIIKTYQAGKLQRDGLNIVITGKPNTGKSSLLNRILGEKRAIVSPIPGTTRDFIEETVYIEGMPVTFTDTAGIRAVDSPIEQEGIELVRYKAAMADIVVILLDGSEPLSQEDIDIINRHKAGNTLLVVNKSDLPTRISDEELANLHSKEKNLRISAKNGDAIPEFKSKIHSLTLKNTPDNGSETVLTNLRHKKALEETVIFLTQARQNILHGHSPEFTAIDLREALDQLAEITGETTNEEVLDRIFSTFCIGK